MYAMCIYQSGEKTTKKKEACACILEAHIGDNMGDEILSSLICFGRCN